MVWRVGKKIKVNYWGYNQTVKNLKYQGEKDKLYLVDKQEWPKVLKHERSWLKQCFSKMCLSFTSYHISGPTFHLQQKCTCGMQTHSNIKLNTTIRMAGLLYLTSCKWFLDFGLSTRLTPWAISICNEEGNHTSMRNNLEGESSFNADPTGDENSVTSSSLVNFWFQNLHFLVWPLLELLSRRHGWGIQASWAVPRFHGWLCNGLATTDNHLLPATIRKHDVLGTTHWKTRSSKQDLKLQRRKGKYSEPQMPINSLLGLFLLLYPGFSPPVWLPLFSMTWEGQLKDKFIKGLTRTEIFTNDF